jgi:hypothetical protein
MAINKRFLNGQDTEIYVNGQTATINLQTGQVTGQGAPGVVVSGASQSGGNVYIDFSGK